MIITEDALLRVVKATRISMNVASAVQKLMPEKTWTWADECAGQLKEAIFNILGERLEPEKSFEESRTMILLTSDMSDQGVVDAILLTDRIKNRVNGHEVVQPAPSVMNENSMKELFEKNGGYSMKGIRYDA